MFGVVRYKNLFPIFRLYPQLDVGFSVYKGANLPQNAVEITFPPFPVKQEILMSDVSNCVTSLKKVANELKSLGAPDGQLQMAQTSIRYVPQGNLGTSSI